jgi:hypothetical protein
MLRNKGSKLFTGNGGENIWMAGDVTHVQHRSIIRGRGFSSQRPAPACDCERVKRSERRVQ